jgi:hypothetical protein
MIATILQGLGAAVVSVGLGLWLPPVGIVAAGIFLVLFGLALERK